MVKKLLTPGSIPELLMRHWERQFTFIFHWGQPVYPLLWPSLTKDLQTEFQNSALRLYCGEADAACMLVYTHEQKEAAKTQLLQL